VRALRGLVEACHAGPTALVTAFAVATAASSGLSTSRTVLVGVAVLLGQLSIGWSNDWRDARDDVRTDRVEKPIVRGWVSARTVGVGAAVAATLCVPASLALGWRPGLAHLVAVASAWAYNFVLKPTPLSWLPFALSFGLLPVVVALALPGHPSADAPVVAASALFGVAAHLTNGVKDMEADAVTGVRGLPQRLGVTAATSLSATAVLAAVVAVAASRPGWAPVLLGAAAAVLAAISVWRAAHGQAQRLFELSMAAAAPVVLAIVVTGGVR
jgi:4-hydroxybenzoate polyprenyltransferase